MRRIGLVLAATVVLLAALLIVAPHLTREHGPRGHQAARLTAPTLRELEGGLQIGCGYDGAVSAPEVCRDGRVVGVYLDDSTPHLLRWLRLAVAKYRRGVVLVSIPMGDPNWRYGPSPPVVNLHEYYPVNSGLPIQDWPDDGLPSHRVGYIVQWSYGGYATAEGAPARAPTPAERERMLREVLQQHPRYLFTY